MLMCLRNADKIIFWGFFKLKHFQDHIANSSRPILIKFTFFETLILLQITAIQNRILNLKQKPPHFKKNRSSTFKCDVSLRKPVLFCSSTFHHKS